MSYLILVDIAYEGTIKETCTSLEEVAAWIRRYNYPLDDIEVYQIGGSVDVYDLMKDTKP